MDNWNRIKMNEKETSNKLKNVLHGCLCQFRLEEITIIKNYKVIFSGKIKAFRDECAENMKEYRDELMDLEVKEKDILHEKLFIFL